MTAAEMPNEIRLHDARRPCIVLSSSPTETDPDVTARRETLSTELLRTHHPWVALAEALQQDREAASRAGWGLEPVGQTYLILLGPLDESVQARLEAALRRWIPAAVLVRVADEAELACLVGERASWSLAVHPLRRTTGSPSDAGDGEHSAENDAPRSTGGRPLLRLTESFEQSSVTLDAADVHARDFDDEPTAPPLDEAVLQEITRQDATSEDDDAIEADAFADAGFDDDEDDVPIAPRDRFVTSEELSMLLRTDDEPDDGYGDVDHALKRKGGHHE